MFCNLLRIRRKNFLVFWQKNSDRTKLLKIFHNSILRFQRIILIEILLKKIMSFVAFGQSAKTGFSFGKKIFYRFSKTVIYVSSGTFCGRREIFCDSKSLSSFSHKEVKIFGFLTKKYNRTKNIQELSEEHFFCPAETLHKFFFGKIVFVVVFGYWGNFFFLRKVFSVAFGNCCLRVQMNVW